MIEDVLKGEEVVEMEEVNEAVEMVVEAENN
jgi:hypothetical protein